VSVGNLEKSQECLSLEKHSSNASLRGIGHVRCSVSCWRRCRVSLDTESAEVNTPDARAVSRASLVPSIRCSVEEEPAAPDAGERPVTLGGIHPLCVRVQCAPNASGVDQQSVRCYCFRCECMLAVGGNGRVHTASDTRLLREHRTLGSSIWWLPAARPVPMCFAQ